MCVTSDKVWSAWAICLWHRANLKVHFRNLIFNLPSLHLIILIYQIIFPNCGIAFSLLVYFFVHVVIDSL